MNLFSVLQLQNKGYDIYFIGKRVYVKHPSWKKKEKIEVKSNILYKLQHESPMALIGNTNEKDLNELWHGRMGHLHHGALKILKKTVTGVPELSTKQDNVCKGCVLGKYAKAVYHRSSNKAKSVLGLIHSDICRPMSTRALSGAEYFVTFIDDHSRETWIYFLKTKDEVFDQFKEFKALVENLTRKQIKTLQSDNGGEYIDKDFTEFCARKGIRREWTTPHNPEHNGIAERKNRTIVEVARAMLYGQDIPKFLWAEACNTVVYVQNWIPHSALGKITPESVFISRKLEVSHFRIFGSAAYCHVPEEKRKKLDKIAEKGYLVRYRENAKAYRIYIPESRKIAIRWDVKLMEERAFRKS